MGCADCDQENELKDRICWYRWGTATIAIRGCKKHVAEVMDALNKAQEGKP